jgi:hypothetical protein
MSEGNGETILRDKFGSVGIGVSSDTHWPRRGGGKKYVSPSGLIYMFGLATKKIVAAHAYSNSCRVCLYASKNQKTKIQIMLIKE